MHARVYVCRMVMLRAGPDSEEPLTDLVPDLDRPYGPYVCRVTVVCVCLLASAGEASGEGAFIYVSTYTYIYTYIDIDIDIDIDV